MEQLKIGDLVETCQFLPGFITEINGDDVVVFIPGKHDSIIQLIKEVVIV